MTSANDAIMTRGANEKSFYNRRPKRSVNNPARLLEDIFILLAQPPPCEALLEAVETHKNGWKQRVKQNDLSQRRHHDAWSERKNLFTTDCIYTNISAIIKTGFNYREERRGQRKCEYTCRAWGGVVMDIPTGP